MVGEISAGSLLFRETCLATLSTSICLLLKILDNSIGIYSYPFSTLTTFTSHCLVLGLYFLVIISSPDDVLACGKFRW